MRVRYVLAGMAVGLEILYLVSLFLPPLLAIIIAFWGACVPLVMGMVEAEGATTPGRRGRRAKQDANETIPRE
jgi:hypothetical protein